MTILYRQFLSCSRTLASLSSSYCPHSRNSRHTGTWGVLAMALAFSMTMCYHATPSLSWLDLSQRGALYILLCCGVKSLIMTIDDILDHDIDAKVERTKNRPIPRGDIGLLRAWMWFTLQVIVGVQLGYNLLNRLTCRWMDFAPVPLAIMFNVGSLMGWTDLRPEEVPWQTLSIVYLATGFWTITFETVYQHQDKLDDVAISARSLALYMGEQTVPLCTATAVLFLSLLSYAAFLNGHGVIFYLSVMVAAWELLVPLSKVNLDIPRDCLKFFLGTPRVGSILLAGLLLDAIVQRYIVGTKL
ncbi:4-hydroxybenzoate polyprenyl transferase [Moniliophthora roreri]|nr:4-hydroxybenzoate polyprenyl transferase [Moniliophthora roreri]